MFEDEQDKMLYILVAVDQTSTGTKHQPVPWCSGSIADFDVWFQTNKWTSVGRRFESGRDLVGIHFFLTSV